MFTHKEVVVDGVNLKHKGTKTYSSLVFDSF